MRRAFAVLLVAAAVGCESSAPSDAPQTDAEVRDAACARRAIATPCCLGAEDCVTKTNMCGEPCKVCWVCRIHTWIGDDRCGREGPCPDAGAESAPPIAATPSFDPAPGAYVGPVAVKITTASPLRISFTLDGTNPHSSSTKYVGPINLATTTTIKAVALGAGWDASEIVTGSYTISGADAATGD